MSFMFEKIKNKLFPRIIKAKYHYDDSLLFVYYSNGNKKIFQGSGVQWREVPSNKFANQLTGEKLFQIKPLVQVCKKEKV